MRVPLILEIVSYSSFLISLVANLLLIFLLTTKSGIFLGSYKKLMICFAIASISYSASDTIYQPLIVAKTAGYLAISSGLFSTTSYGEYIGVFFCANYCNTLLMIALHYIYRYLSVCKEKRLFLFQGFYFPLWFIPILIINLLWCYGILFLINRNEHTDAYVRSQVRELYDVNIEDYTYLAILYFYEENGKKIYQWRVILMILLIVIIQGITFSITIICGRHTFRTLKSATVSNKGKKLQRKLFKMLLVQTGSPLLLMYFSVLLLLVPTIFGLHIGKWSILISCSLSVYPATEPLIILYFIGDFKRTILGWFRIRSIKVVSVIALETSDRTTH